MKVEMFSPLDWPNKYANNSDIIDILDFPSNSEKYVCLVPIENVITSSKQDKGEIWVPEPSLASVSQVIEYFLGVANVATDFKDSYLSYPNLLSDLEGAKQDFIFGINQAKNKSSRVSQALKQIENEGLKAIDEVGEGASELRQNFISKLEKLKSKIIDAEIAKLQLSSLGRGVEVKMKRFKLFVSDSLPEHNLNLKKFGAAIDLQVANFTGAGKKLLESLYRQRRWINSSIKGGKNVARKIWRYAGKGFKYLGFLEVGLDLSRYFKAKTTTEKASALDALAVGVASLTPEVLFIIGISIGGASGGLIAAGSVVISIALYVVYFFWRDELLETLSDTQFGENVQALVEQIESYSHSAMRKVRQFDVEKEFEKVRAKVALPMAELKKIIEQYRSDIHHAQPLS